MKQVSPGTVTVGVLAILFGLVAAYAARHYLEDEPILLSKAKPKTASIVVPRLNLPKYARIRDDDVETIEIPVDNLPEGAVTMKSRALYRLVKTTVMAGQPLMEEDLYRVGEVPMLADQLPPGYRAVTLQVDADSAINGMIQPESFVDVSLTVKGDHPELGGLATLTLLRRVQVMATSQARFPHPEDTAGRLRNLTVAVTPEQANKLILAQQYGTLSCTLRSSLEDEMVVESDGERDLINPEVLLGLNPPAIEPVPQSVEKTAQIWRNGSVQEVTFDESQIREALNATAVAEGKSPLPSIPMAGPRDAAPTRPKTDCKTCGNKKNKNRAADRSKGEPTAAFPAAGQPTVAPAAHRPTPSITAGIDATSAGQVIEIEVQSESGGAGR
jgi:pilus assembly protein CpaB